MIYKNLVLTKCYGFANKTIELKFFFTSKPCFRI